MRNYSLATTVLMLIIVEVQAFATTKRQDMGMSEAVKVLRWLEEQKSIRNRAEQQNSEVVMWLQNRRERKRQLGPSASLQRVIDQTNALSALLTKASN